ncbi:MAG: hypothetical protein ACLQPD_17545, partial [Desulfomonilaceae bacterium]
LPPSLKFLVTFTPPMMNPLGPAERQSDRVAIGQLLPTWGQDPTSNGWYLDLFYGVAISEVSV